jgi:hypothetical protein
MSEGVYCFGKTRTATALCSSRPEPRAFGKHLQYSQWGKFRNSPAAQTSKFLIPIAACFEPEALNGRLLHSAAAVRFGLF